MQNARFEPSSTENPKGSRPWRAGSAVKAAVGAAAFAWAAAAMAAPQVLQGRQAQDAALPAAWGLAPHANARVGQALAARLAEHPNLPDARIAMMAWRDGDKGSRGGFNPKSQSCEVVAVADPRGWGTLASNLPDSLGLAPKAAWAERLFALEIIHEIGHCEAGRTSARFSLPGLPDEDSQAIAAAMKGSSMERLWHESLADAYAGITLLSDAKGPAQAEQAAKDLGALRAWRAKSREDAALYANLGAKIPNGSTHATEAVFEELSREPSAWLDPATPLIERAAKLASVALARSAKMMSDPAAAADDAFGARAAMERAFGALADKIRSPSTTAAALAGLAPDARSAFSSAFGRNAAEHFGTSPDPFAKAASTEAAAIAGLSFDAAAAAMKLRAPSDKELRQAWGEVMRRAAEDGTLARAMAALPPDALAQRGRAASAWSSALSMEAAAPSQAAPASPLALAAMSSSIQAGEALAADPARSPPAEAKLRQWRSGKYTPAAAAASPRPPRG